MWPSFNQRLCATLPEEVQCETRMAQSLLLHQHDRTADQESIQEEKKFSLTLLTWFAMHFELPWPGCELFILSSSWAHLAKKTVPILQISLLPLAILTAPSSWQIYLPEAYPSFLMHPPNPSTRKISWCLETLHAALSHISSCPTWSNESEFSEGSISTSPNKS